MLVPPLEAKTTIKHFLELAVSRLQRCAEIWVDSSLNFLFIFFTLATVEGFQV